MEIMKAKVFYRIFASTDKAWSTRITDEQIRESLQKRVSYEFIRKVKSQLQKEGVLTIEGDLIQINYTNTRLY